MSSEIVPPTKPPSGESVAASERSRRTFKILVPVIAAVAGLLAATAVATSQGGQLPGQRDNLPGLVADRQAAVARLDRKAQQLRAAVDRSAGTSAAGSQQVRIARSQEAALDGAAGLTAVSGAGLVVSLDDAPRSARGQRHRSQASLALLRMTSWSISRMFRPRSTDCGRVVPRR